MATQHLAGSGVRFARLDTEFFRLAGVDTVRLKICLSFAGFGSKASGSGQPTADGRRGRGADQHGRTNVAFGLRRTRLAEQEIETRVQRTVETVEVRLEYTIEVDDRSRFGPFRR